MLIPKEKISEILSKNDIVEVIRGYLPVTRHGKDFKCVCPFHDDNRPSMSISSEKQIFKCFSCNEGGNAITFVQKYENISFLEATKKLADRAGVELYFNVKSIQVDPEKERFFNLLKQVEEFSSYSIFTEEGKEALQYLQENRKLDEATIKDFRIGFISNKDCFLSFMQAKGYTNEEMSKLGITNDYQNSFLVNRISFPIHDVRGRTVGFSCRSLPNREGPKYINTSENVIFTKGNNLFNLDNARKDILKEKEVIVMEGQMNPIKANTIGIKNCVAQMGTALTSNQIKLLKELNVTVKLMYDGDSSGQINTLKNYNALQAEGIKVKALLLPNGMDPDEVIDMNPNQFKEICNRNDNIIDYQLQQNIDSYENYDEMDKYTQRILKSLIDMKDPLIEDFYLPKISDKTGFSSLALSKKIELMRPENLSVKITSSKREVKKQIYSKTKKSLIKFNVKTKMKSSNEVKNNYDRLRAENKVMIFDKNGEMNRVDLLKKYLELKGTVLESTITLLNTDKNSSIYTAAAISEASVKEMATVMDIPFSNVDYISYLHLDTTHPHLHIQLFQKETYLEQYDLSSRLSVQLQKTVDGILNLNTVDDIELTTVQPISI